MNLLQQMESQLHHAFVDEYRRQGVPYHLAGQLARSNARLVVARYQAGWPEEALGAGLGLSLKSIVKSVSKPFKKAAKFVEKKILKPIEKAVIRPVAKGVVHAATEFEQHVIRPVAHWEYLPVVASLIPGYGQVLGPAINAAQTARTLYVANKDNKAALRDYNRAIDKAYALYVTEAQNAGVLVMNKEQFEYALQMQAQGRTF